LTTQKKIWKMNSKAEQMKVISTFYKVDYLLRETPAAHWRHPQKTPVAFGATLKKHPSPSAPPSLKKRVYERIASVPNPLYKEGKTSPRFLTLFKKQCQQLKRNTRRCDGTLFKKEGKELNESNPQPSLANQRFAGKEGGSAEPGVSVRIPPADDGCFRTPLLLIHVFVAPNLKIPLDKTY